jgi:hypothetical protein
LLIETEPEGLVVVVGDGASVDVKVDVAVNGAGVMVNA